MTGEVTLTFACYNYDRLRPLFDGRVKVPGCTLVPVFMKSEQVFPRALQREEFDVSELSVSSYLMQTSRGESRYIALPAFVSRAFRHGTVYVRKQSGIATPKDLEGKRVGVPEYQVTIALWMRGILQDEYGVDFKKMRFRNGGINRPGRKERLPLRLPPDIDVEPLPTSKSINDCLISGELDAAIVPEVPAAFLASDSQIKRLFDPSDQVEREYFRSTNFFPIMHFIGIRKTVAAQHPGIAAALFRAMIEAKRIAQAELHEVARYSASMLMLPWLLAEYERTVDLMGANYWKYGVRENYRELKTMCRYSKEQFLAERKLDVDELFEPSTVEIRDE